MKTDLILFKAKIYDMTEVIALKKVYDKDHKRKPSVKGRRWEYHDEAELQRSKRLLEAAVERLRSGLVVEPQPVRVGSLGFSV